MFESASTLIAISLHGLRRLVLDARVTRKSHAGVDTGKLDSRHHLGVECLSQSIIDADAEFQRIFEPRLGEYPRRAGAGEFGSRRSASGQAFKTRRKLIGVIDRAILLPERKDSRLAMKFDAQAQGRAFGKMGRAWRR